MFRTKLTLAGLAVAAAVFGATSHRALAAHDSWYGYAVSVTNAQQSAPFITDTLAPGGKALVNGRDPWYGYAVSLTQAQQSPSFITDTLAPGGRAPVQSDRFITDTLAPGGTAPVQSDRFITDTLAPGGGPSEVSAPSSNGFDWGDAGIGAGVMAGIGLMLLGSARLLHRRNVVAV
jgi:hypothetical protein